MRPLFSRYAELGQFLDDGPDAATDWKWLVWLALAGYCSSLGVHLLEAANWGDPFTVAGTERIMATHDAYCWLAGAMGVNEYAQFGMARLAALLSSVTGLPLWKIGFWAPPFLGSLTAVVTGLWAWLLAGRRAAILPFFLGALSPGFFYRSRLGYFDSDSFTMLMPLLLGFGLAVLISRSCSRTWLPAGDEARQPLPGWLPWLALGFGLVGRVAHFAHDDIHGLGLGLFWLALGLAAVTGLPGRRVGALRLLLIYGLAAYAGPRHFGAAVFAPGPADLAGLALAAGLAWAVWRRGATERGALFGRWFDSPWPWLALLAAMTATCGLLLSLAPFWAKALSYFKPVADLGLAPGGQGPSYPGITQSIREAKNVADLGLFLAGVSASTLTGAAGALGILALLALRPGFLLLMPMAGLGLASLVLGARFSMFGGPAFAVGLGVGAHWLTKALSRRFGWGARPLVWTQALLTAGCLVLGYIPRYMDIMPSPVLSPAHAQALTGLRDSIPKDAEVWTWWDYGYATQYFAGRMTPTDGGKHAGRDMYPTALALTTPSFRQAAQVILSSAGQDNNPARRWDTMSARAVQQELEALKTSDADLPPARRPQYLVTCWDNVSLLYWITFYGSWDLVAGKGTHARIMTVREPFSLDQDRGRMVLESNNTPIPLASGEVLTDKGLQRLAMPEHPGGAHLVINNISKQAMLLDDVAYNSTAVQLLIGNPDRPEQARYFKLLHEGFPLVRIYEVLTPAQRPAEQAKANQ